ncbi:MAG: hypothetical protein K6A41_00520 [Bacteroidales bacterium]|nr:hypothetical protein [Bacteroidales bacterium]
MKNAMKFWLSAAILIFGMTFSNCKNKTADIQSDADVVDTTVTVSPAAMTIEEAINAYLVSEIASHYSPGDVCIPCCSIIATDESNADSVLIWGDFWVYNYNISGDTLKTVSGGDHPGLMQLRKTDNGYEVVNFDVVADGSGNVASAKKIFGKYYEDFHAVNSNHEQREKERAQITANYVKEHNLAVKMYQDFGWPVVKLSLK